MTSDKSTIVEQVNRRAEEGSLPDERCVNCDGLCAELHPLYAICARANRQWESEGGGFVAGIVGGVPFLLPTSSEETIEIREGDDVFVPVPIRVCNECWQKLYGGLPTRVLAFVAQSLFLAGLVMIVVWVVSKARGGEVSFLYAAACFGASIPFHVMSELLQSRWRRRIRAYLDKVPEYATLFAAYPNAEVVMKEPIAMVSDDS